MLTQLEVTINRAFSTYPIWIGRDVLHQTALWMPGDVSRVVIITDDEVKWRYAVKLEQSLQAQGYFTLLLSFSAGEISKNAKTKSTLEDAMLLNGCDRDSLVIALGGGVVGDLAGFVAATFLRGIRYIQIPTTLLAMVDSSVGGKTAIDTPYGKNLIGAFWQPIAVVADINCLKTLPKDQMINGLIEVIKVFLIQDAPSFNELASQLNEVLNGDENLLINLIHRAVSIKVALVSHDERDMHQRALLNLGHTIGHALEKLNHYQGLHGYAVALGLLVESTIAQLMGLLAVEKVLLIKQLLSRLGITNDMLMQFDQDEIIHATYADKKTRAGCVRYVLLSDIGRVHQHQHQFVHPVADELVKQALGACME